VEERGVSEERRFPVGDGEVVAVVIILLLLDVRGEALTEGFPSFSSSALFFKL